MNISSLNESNEVTLKTDTDTLALLISKNKEHQLLNLPNFRVSEGHALLMARKLVAQLRKSDIKAKQTFKTKLRDLRSRSLGRKAFNNIRQIMLSQLGAFELQLTTRKKSVVYYLEVGEPGDETVYLCSYSCSRKNPLRSWCSTRHAGLTRHALERAFLRGCIWLKGQSIHLGHIIKELFDIHVSHMAYQATYFSQYKDLIKHGWHINLSDMRTQYIVRHDLGKLPMVVTVYKAEDEVPEGGIAKMIPPEGSFGNPKLLTNLSQLSQQTDLKMVA